LICMDEFTEDGDNCPLNLDCGHSVCKGCLGKLLANKKYQCPTCKKSLQKTRVDDYPKNYFAISMLAQIKKGNQGCKCGVDNSLYCKRCKEYFCKECTAKHGGHPVSVYDPQSRVELEKFDSLHKDLIKQKDTLVRRCTGIEREEKEALISQLGDLKAVEVTFRQIRDAVERLESSIVKRMKDDYGEKLKILEKEKNRLEELNFNIEEMAIQMGEYRETVPDILEPEGLQFLVQLNKSHQSTYSEIKREVNLEENMVTMPIYQIDKGVQMENRLSQLILDLFRKQA